MKRRKQKAEEYDQKYEEVPRDFQERLYWMYDKFHINDHKEKEIIDKRNRMLSSLQFQEFFIILYEEPEGTPRPRVRLVNRTNIANEAMANSSFIQVYSLTGAEDNRFMRRLIKEQDLRPLDDLICTPCEIEYTAYFHTPSSFNSTDKFLAEIGMVNPITKPDWDNIGKKYSDMYNANIWIDDSLVIKATVNKKYSMLPRVEIRLRYLNMLYNRYQYKSMIDRAGQEVKYFE